ncbi:hypothetical protein SPRG_02044 [Saprolegnia parasitica CBS 223.65]|uniref:TRAF-type domain-containing protein n=1 Tax=Saprolegnia parasitica (strain CBS 223.65) TaxID=695850 RepID=A0A067CRD2_SAPPC|nr:hypothetical protein SPRG_02044 [Saprolegnia parasitica CBS 223.65]KDO33234.1 hypothetical protein SPRG_02044 [Saprolegnia parasitica CBS 223.65]|eukprot:XP_012195991.1 hypothetical protein SPRG_02044 [Saprolegnia parasitica CBS 223.65]
MASPETSVVLPKVATSSVQWSPAKLASRETTLFRSIQEIDAQRTLLLNKARRRCQSTPALQRSPLASPTKKPPRIVEDHILCSCGNDVALRQLKHHQAVECSHRLIACPHHGCDACVPAHALPAHETSTCLVYRHTRQLLDAHHIKATLSVCCLACEVEVPLRLLAAHTALECAMRRVPCPHASLGCAETNLVYRHLENHFATTCCVAKHRAAMLEASKTVNDVVHCDWCNEPVKKRHMTDHKEDACLMRERPCPNWPLGCREWVPVGAFVEHMRTVCSVTIGRHELAKRAAIKDGHVPCRECGDEVPLRKLPQHARVSCPARLVLCANAVHGCKATLKFRDRHIHEDVNVSPEARAVLRFNTRQGYVRLDGGDDRKPPWCAEFWVHLFSKADDVLHFMSDALRWQATLRATFPRLDGCIADEKALKERIKTAVLRTKGSKDDSELTQLQAQAQLVDEGISGCKSIIAEANARIFSLVSDAATLVMSIHDIAERASLSDQVRAQAQVLQPSWSKADLDLYGHVEHWLAALKTAAATAKTNETPHAKLIKKRLQLLQAIEDHERSRPTDVRESARFLKQAKKELSRLDDKLATHVDVPLTLAQSPIGFHTIAGSKAAGIHLVMVAGAGVGVHTFDTKARFKAELPRERWVHMALNASATSVQLVLDGSVVDERPGTFHLPMETLGATEKSFRGHLQEVRYWTTTRTPSEISASIGTTLNLVPTLQGYWTLEEGMGPFIEDVSGHLPRGPAFNTYWSHYTTATLQRLGDPPTPSFRQRHMCAVVVRRNFLAHKHATREVAGDCSLGCGLHLPLTAMDHHVRCDCPQRMDVCAAPGCGRTFKVSRGHHCRVTQRRNDLAAEYARKHELVECPFGCGESIIRQDVPRHRKLDCSCRFVLCLNDGCGRSYIQRNAKWHVAHDCDAPHVVAKRAMVQRSRQRQAATPSAACSRGTPLSPPRPPRRPVTTTLPTDPSPLPRRASTTHAT